MTQTFEQWAESEGLDMSVDWTGELTSPVTAWALRGWEGAQSAGQEPIGYLGKHDAEWLRTTPDVNASCVILRRPSRGGMAIFAAPVNGGERVEDERQKCQDCYGKGFNDVDAQVSERESDVQTFRETCEACDGTGKVGERAADAPQVGGDERVAYIASLPADWHKDSSLETWFPLTAEELSATKRMFGAACADLGRINEALGLDPDDAGAEPILDAIEELKARAALSADGGKDKRDAERWRFIREEHEGTESFDDAEGFTITEPTARAFTVFKPGRDVHLEPIGCMPGELDAAIDAAIAAKQSGKGGE